MNLASLGTSLDASFENVDWFGWADIHAFGQDLFCATGSVLPVGGPWLSFNPCPVV